MPLYENEETLQKETEAIKRIESVLRVTYKKLPIQYSLDFAAVSEDQYIDHWAEIKCRQFESTRYREYVLSFEKILKARELSSSTGLPSYLFLTFTDGVSLKTRIDDVDDWQPKWGGRTKQTRRRADIHPVVMIPSKWFDRIC